MVMETMQIRMNERDFVKQKFAEYYQKNTKRIQPPASIEKREFGFVLFEERMMIE
jgi:DNA primase catalytic subunit